MNNRPLISVILPCFNAQYFLPLALDSIINQTYTNLEILCINDGSTDKTADILEEFAKKDKRIRVVHNEKNLKLIGTLNKAIALAKGEFIARMDADDISNKERIEKLYSILISKNVDVVSCNNNHIDVFGVHKATSFLKAITPLEIQFSSYFFTPIGHALLLGKRDAFIDTLYSESGIALHTEDYELWTRMIRKGVSFYNLDEVLYSIRINDDSVSRKFESIQIANFIKSAQIHQELLLNKKLEYEIVAVAVNRIDQPKIKNIRQGFKLINEIVEAFSTSTILNKKERKSILLIVAMQKADISIQSLKKGGLNIRIYAGLLLFGLLVRNAFNSKFKGYLRLKF